MDRDTQASIVGLSFSQVELRVLVLEMLEAIKPLLADKKIKQNFEAECRASLLEASQAFQQVGFDEKVIQEALEVHLGEIGSLGGLLN